VPAAVVIPALIAYIKIVAVEKLVVRCWTAAGCRLRSDGRLVSFYLRMLLHFVVQNIYFERTRLCKACLGLNTLHGILA